MFYQSSSDPSDNNIKTLFQKVDCSSWFIRIKTHIKSLQALQTVFDKECPLELVGKCQVIEIKGDCLYIGVENAGLATQLQYRTRELVQALNKHSVFTNLKKIRARIVAI